MRRFLRTSILILLTNPTLSFADPALVATNPPVSRPYPYELLGLQPGDTRQEIDALFTKRSDEPPQLQTETLRIQSPNGAVFAFDYLRALVIGDIGFHGRVANDPQDMLTVELASDVWDGKAISITRQLRQPSAELPKPLELKAQLEGLYGPASRAILRGTRMELTYAWSTEGLIPDLDRAAPLVHEEKLSDTSIRRSTYEICGSASHYRNSTQYRFQHPRKEDIKPGCIATYTIKYAGGPQITSIDFILKDFELARQHTKELDRQIHKALATQVKASDLDL